MSPKTQDNLYLGWDLSTTQLKGIAVNSDLKLVYQAHADFDDDFSRKYGVVKGVLTHPDAGEIFAPNAMWLEAVDLVLGRLKEQGCDFSKVRGISGAGMQHGTVFWNHNAGELLKSLKGDKPLIDQLKGAFSHPHSPNWQDASTQSQCEQFDDELGGQEELANLTGSKAHHRFSGPQILRFRKKFSEDWSNTGRITLVSSFLATLFLGKFASIDIADVCGMNLWHIKAGKWNEKLLKLTAGDGEGAVEDLKKKLGPVYESGGDSFGRISNYYVERYGFSPSCEIAPFTGDNPSTILSLPLQPSDAIVSLGTSTTFLMNTPEYKPDPAYHFTNHPTTPGHYMFMLCYKNGSLARERVRDALNSFKELPQHQPNIPAAKSHEWEAFNQVALKTPQLGQPDEKAPMKLGMFFPRPEIVPQLPAGDWTYLYDANSKKLQATKSVPTPAETALSSHVADPDAHVWHHPHHTVRATLESQFLSCRLRSHNLVKPHGDLPPQPRRIYVVGGGAVNAAIVQVCGEVLGGAEGVYRLDIGGNACALGSAYKAVWAFDRSKGETFEELIGARWREEDFVEKVDIGYRKGVYERYGVAVQGFREMERLALEEENHPDRKRRRRPSLTMGSALTRERTGELEEMSSH